MFLYKYIVDISWKKVWFISTFVWIQIRQNDADWKLIFLFDFHSGSLLVWNNSCNLSG
jgi:hypothetical protein